MFLTSERLEEITAPLRDCGGTDDEFQNTFDKILESVTDWGEKAQICNYLSARFRRGVITSLQEKLDAAVKKREETVTVSIVELAEVLNMAEHGIG